MVVQATSQAGPSPKKRKGARRSRLTSLKLKADREERAHQDDARKRPNPRELPWQERSNVDADEDGPQWIKFEPRIIRAAKQLAEREA